MENDRKIITFLASLFLIIFSYTSVYSFFVISELQKKIYESDYYII